MPPGLSSLWKDQWLERIDLDPLGTEDVRNITNEVLGKVEPRLEEELWRLTRGNPLLLREVIEGSKDSTIRRDEEGVWRPDGELATTARLADLVDEPVANLPEEFSPVTPALAHRPQLVSPREVEIALAAASGSSSPDIASSHFISVRTVDNHLVSVYRKLGIGGREEPAELLSVAPADGSGQLD